MAKQKKPSKSNGKAAIGRVFPPKTRSAEVNKVSIKKAKS